MVQIPREYVPGKCNIGRQEETLRWLGAWVWTGLTVATALVLLALRVPFLWRLVVVAPAFLAALGFVQGFLHFCVQFGLKGLYNVGPDLGVTSSVAQEEFVRRDKAHSFRLLRLSAAVAVLVTLVILFL